MIAFVTGATGFIGHRVVVKLIERNYKVVALVRNPGKARQLFGDRIQILEGDILDPSSMKPGMKNCDVVFHLAGWYKLGSRDQSLAHVINVDGTRNVLGLAWELNIPKIVYTSSLSIYGDTQKIFHGEDFQRSPGQSFLTEYERTKWHAHFQVALPMISHGAPITIVIPGVAYGPNDSSLIGQLMAAFLKGYLQALPGPETVQSFAHVDDIASGHILTFEKGKVGQSYILAGPVYPLWQIVKLWSSLSGIPYPKYFVPSNWLKPLEQLAHFLSSHLPMPELLSVDGIRLLDSSYGASAQKAITELGWRPRSIEYGYKETLEWYMDRSSG